METYGIGSLVLNEARLGLGVVSAIVGDNVGWMVTLFEPTQEQLVSVLLEWALLEGNCWFELDKEMGFNQSSTVMLFTVL